MTHACRNCHCSYIPLCVHASDLSVCNTCTCLVPPRYCKIRHKLLWPFHAIMLLILLTRGLYKLMGWTCSPWYDMAILSTMAAYAFVL